MAFKSFSDLRKNQQENFQKLQEKLKGSDNNSQRKEDPTFWDLKKDDAGNGSAVIRFLPAPMNEELPYVCYHTHYFKGPKGKTYYARSLSDLNKPDPVAELNRELWNSNTEEGKAQASRQKRKKQYIANIYVLKDPAKPENEGKVFKFKFGQKIFEKIKEVSVPEDEDDTPVDVFDIFSGANFRIKVKQVAGYANYDSSKFDNPSELLEGDEEKLETIWKSCFSLAEIVDEKNYETYEKLSQRLNEVLGVNNQSNTNHKNDNDDLSLDDEDEVIEQKQSTSSKKKETKKEETISEDDDFDLGDLNLDDLDLD